MKYKLLFALATLSFLSPLSAQKKKKVKPEATPLQQPLYDSVFSSLHWRNIGPFRGGRANTVAGVVNNSSVFYAGYTGGGIWKTIDGGVSWHNTSDGFFKVGSIGDIAVSESDPNVVYAGTGEHAVRGVMTTYGNGVYKSVDAGRTWNNIGLEKTRHIADVAIHPQNPDILWVAAQGTVHGPNNDRGVFKSIDGGLTWKKTLYINDSTGITSLSLDMTNPRILYAASWQHQRLPWTVNSGGNGSAIWKSTDGGETWKKIVSGLPDKLGKIGVAVSRANSNRVFAIVEAEKSVSGLYRSDDAGASWSLLSNNQDICSRSWYYMKVQADPVNENLVYVMNAPLMRSIDGGRTFSALPVAHGDTHDLWINPKIPAAIALADDGGAEISYNGGNSWSSIMNQPTGQFYRVATDNVFPYKVYGGQQDNTSVIIASRNNFYGITQNDWSSGPGCESAYLAFQEENPEQVMGGCYQGYIEILDTKTNEVKDIQAYPSLNLAILPKQMRYRFNWNAPIVASVHEKGTYYHAGNVLFKTTNNGQKWDVISPDLTRNDTTKQGPGGGPLTNEGAGGENYNTIYYVKESPVEKGNIWTGSDCGLVYLTQDGGKNWTNVTPSDLSESMIHSIEVSPHDKGTAYISATRYKFNDYSSYTYKTTDYGKSWTKIISGIASDDFIRVIREDKNAKGVLYAGAERGFYISLNGGANWQSFQLNLPVVTITDITFRDNDMVISTAGRGFWILDDLSAIQKSAIVGIPTTVKIFQPKASILFGGGVGLPEEKNTNDVGQNAPEGVIFDYYLPEKSDTNLVKLEILDKDGKLVRSYTNKKDAAYKPYPGGPPPPIEISGNKGMNRVLWDFRNATISPDVTGAFVYGDYRGYRISPGSYTARLSYKSSISETKVDVIKDPNLTADATSWTEQQVLLKRISEQISSMHKKVNDLRKIKKQVEGYNLVFKDQTQYKELVTAGSDLIAKMDKWESEIVESRIKNGQDVINWPSKLNAEFFNLKSLADTHNPVVTDGVKNRLADLESKWNLLNTAYEQELKKAINDYNTLFKNKNIPAIVN